MKIRRETKIGLTAIIAALIAIVAVALIAFGMVSGTYEKLFLFSIFYMCMIAITYCSILDWHKPDPHWKVKLSFVVPCYFTGLLMVDIYGNMSIAVILKLLLFWIVVFAVSYACLFVTEKYYNFKISILEKELKMLESDTAKK